MVALKRTPSKKIPKKRSVDDDLFIGAILPIKRKKPK
jgi:hypothetical protein